MADEDILDPTGSKDPILRALQKAKPNWLGDHLGVRGNPQQFNQAQVPVEWPVAKAVARQADTFSERPTIAPTVQASVGGSSTFPFQLTSSANSIDATALVTIRDGRVNDDLPSGMGANNYAVTVNADSTFYVVLTFDPGTLETTSLTLGYAYTGSEPDSSLTADLGTLIILLGEVVFSYDIHSNLIVAPRNIITSNINFELIYGAVNGDPSLLPVATWGTGWLAIPT